MDVLKEVKNIKLGSVSKNMLLPFFTMSAATDVFSATIISEIGNIYGKDVSAIIMMMVYYLFAKKLHENTCDTANEIRRKMDELLKNTESYQELKYEYDEFITSIAKYLKSKNLKTSKEIVLYLNEMLKSGGLSFTNFYCYHKHKYSNDYIVDLYGSRITTGTGVCRHEAAFVTDVMNKCGYDSFTIPVYVKKEKTPTCMAKIFPSTHSIMGIIDEEGKYSYDPTWKSFVNPTENKKILYPINSKKYVYCVDRNNAFKFENSSRISAYERARCLPFIQLNKDELIELEYEIIKLFISEKKIDEEFYNDESSRIERIAKLSMEVLPCSDEKVRKWALK